MSNEKIKDSGSTQEFTTGAHRDNAAGKGRCDLLPMKCVAMVMHDDPVFACIHRFMEDRNIVHLAEAIRASVKTVNKFHYTTFYDELAKEGIELRGIHSENPTELKNASEKASLAHMMLEASKLYEAGAIKYGANNWQLGMPVNRYIDSGMRHYLKTLRGDVDEPHYRGFIWNLLCAMWTAENLPEQNYKEEPQK